MHDAYPDRFQLSPALAAIADGGEPVMLVDEPRTREQIVEDVLEAVADEVHRLLEEGVVTEAADVDTGLLLGAGWPFFLGGITKHLDQIGMSERLFGHTFAEMKEAAPA
jgi:3-hydroxyacyl-CoA dehydrogenase